MARFEFQIDERFHRWRLDEFLFNEFRSMSKAYLRRVVKEESCELNGEVANSGITLKSNDFVEIDVEIDFAKGMKPEEMPLDIVYEDKDVVVINKAAGVLVHPTNYERNGTLLNGLTHYLNQNSGSELFIRPHLVHRLDRETSGLIVTTTNSRASKILSSHFARDLFKKTYVALVEGAVESEFGEINASIGRNEEDRKWQVFEDGKVSQTKYSVLERFSDSTLLELEPVTGRTNQLRIHCAHIGHPIVGDEMHTENPSERLCLHAIKLSFFHPNGGERIELETEMPDRFRR